MAKTVPRSQPGPTEPTSDQRSPEELIARYVQEDPNGRGRHRAYVVVGDRTWTPIWVLAGYLRHGSSAAQAAAAYDLPEEAVLAAFAYYDRHRALFDAWLLLNEQSSTPTP
jgi:hypothetical protein